MSQNFERKDSVIHFIKASQFILTNYFTVFQIDRKQTLFPDVSIGLILVAEATQRLLVNSGPELLFS